MKKKIKMLTLDTETYNGLKGGLKRIAIYDGKKVYYGYRFEDVEYILDNYSYMGYQLIVYIHNMEFDLRKIPEVFRKGNINWKQSLAINGKLAKLSCKNYSFMDSFKILPMSLSSLSKDMGVEHGKLNLWDEVQKMYPNEYKDVVDFLDRCHIDDELYLKYLGYDVMSLYEVLEVLMEISGLKLEEFSKCVSTSSLARYLFKKGYKGKPFKNPNNASTDYDFLTCFNWKNNLELEEFLRESYCGGRTEVFIPRLEQEGYYNDVNSLYPFVMSKWGKEEKALYPIGKGELTSGELAKEVFFNWRDNRLGLGFINALVYVPMQDIPPLPVKKGKLTFPCGEIYGTWTYEELEYAMSECGVELKEVYCVCHFKHTYPVFKRFIEEMYFLKEQATIEKNNAARTFAKLIYNTSYGYTGMKRDDKTTLLPFDENELYRTKSYNEELGFMEVPTDVNAEYIQVQVASYVTSRARLVLLKGIKDIIARGGKVYYCDTDSIISDIPMSEEMYHESKLGFWDLECKPIKGLFLKPKVYSLVLEDNKEKVKFKGVSKETQKELDFHRYETLYQELLEGKKKQVIVEKNKTTLRSILYLQKTGKDLLSYETRDKVMNINSMEKRKIDYKNNQTEPYYFKSEKEFEEFSYKPVNKFVDFDMC